jgi:hypothetical protein
MRIIDKIALQRLISMLLTFILAVLKLFMPSNTEVDDNVDNPKPKPKRKRIFPRVNK